MISKSRLPFNFIVDKEFVMKIAKSKLKPIKAGIFEKYRLDLEFEDEMKFVAYISSEVDVAKGGRDILNAINDHLLDPLAMFMFENKNNLSSFRGGKILVKLTTKGLGFEFDIGQ